MQKNEVRIGVFDSGIGGLTVLRECAALLPRAAFYYLGDNFRAPYGGRSKEEIRRLAAEAMEEFAALKIDAAVLACNTVTAVCAEELRKHCSFPVVGMEPAVKLAARSCSRALVLATPRTIESDRLRRLVSECPRCKFTLRALPDLARAVERAAIYGEPLDLSAHLPDAEGAEGVVLGCTHYVYFSDQISTFYQKPVFDGNFGTARQLALLINGLKSVNVGTEIHQLPQAKNKHMYEKPKTKGENHVFFLGKAAELNKKVYFRTFVSQKIKNY